MHHFSSDVNQSESGILDSSPEVVNLLDVLNADDIDTHRSYCQPNDNIA